VVGGGRAVTKLSYPPIFNMNPILTTCSISNHRDGGRYYKLPRLFGKERPEIKKIQFVGLAGNPGCPVLTVARPIDVESVLSLSLMNITVDKIPVMWIGGVKCYKVGTGLKYYIPKHLHNVMGGDATKGILCMAKTSSKRGVVVLVLNTKGRVSNVERPISDGGNQVGAPESNAVETGRRNAI
jgi:hypothetical protein